MTVLHLGVYTIWLMALLMPLVKTHRSSAFLYRIQALGEAVIAATLAVTRPDTGLWVGVVLILIIKLCVVPRVLTRAHREIGKDYGAQSAIGLAALLAIDIPLSLGGVLAGYRLGFGDPVVVGVLLAAWFITFLHLTVRYEVWNLAWALLGLDTISGAGVLVISNTLSIPGDVIIDVIPLILAGVAAFVVAQIVRFHHTTDERRLKELIG